MISSNLPTYCSEVQVSTATYMRGSAVRARDWKMLQISTICHETYLRIFPLNLQRVCTSSIILLLHSPLCPQIDSDGLIVQYLIGTFLYNKWLICNIQHYINIFALDTHTGLSNVENFLSVDKTLFPTFKAKVQPGSSSSDFESSNLESELAAAAWMINNCYSTWTIILDHHHPSFVLKF